MLGSDIMLHELIRTWFHWVEIWGYAGVFILMAMESSIFPVPSEVVMPPAAFWAAQGRMSFAGVIIAGTAGSYFGSIVSYGISRWLGKPLVYRYGKYFFLSEKNLSIAENWVRKFGTFGIFIARLLPVIRHLISIPAGIFRMNVGRFSLATVVGAGLWCYILSWIGQEIIGSHPELLQSPEAMIAAIKAKLHGIILAVLLFAFSYGILIWLKKKVTPSNLLKSANY
jgi:membrane protein DedA with SNARE-associated domain